MTRHDPPLAARLQTRQPDIDAMRRRLPDLKELPHKLEVEGKKQIQH